MPALSLTKSGYELLEAHRQTERVAVRLYVVAEVAVAVAEVCSKTATQVVCRGQTEAGAIATAEGPIGVLTVVHADGQCVHGVANANCHVRTFVGLTFDVCLSVVDRCGEAATELGVEAYTNEVSNVFLGLVTKADADRCATEVGGVTQAETPNRVSCACVVDFSRTDPFLQPF